MTELLTLSRRRARSRPWLHIESAAWDQLRSQLANHPTPAYRRCQDDMRPSPSRPPRPLWAVVEAAAFVAAVSDQSNDREWLKTHLALLEEHSAEVAVDIATGQSLAALAWCVDILADVLPGQEYQHQRQLLIDRATLASAAVAAHSTTPGEAGLMATLAGLELAALALITDDDAPAEAWLTAADARLLDMLQTEAIDGWWATGVEAWNALLPLVTRCADAWLRLADRDLFEHGLLRHAWRVALHGVAPNGRDLFDLEDDGTAAPSRAATLATGRSELRYDWRLEPARWCLGRLHQRFDETGFRAALARWTRAGVGYTSPFALIFDPRTSLTQATNESPHHVFADYGLAIWRTGWHAEAQAVTLASGPAHGGHHAQANHFCLWAGGTPLVDDLSGTDHATSGWHNTVLVDGREQLPPAARVDHPPMLVSHWFSDIGGALLSEAAGAYPRDCELVTYDRHLGFAAGYVVVWDVLAAKRPTDYEWRMHSPLPIVLDQHDRATVRAEQITLRAALLRPDRLDATVEQLAIENAQSPVHAYRLRLAARSSGRTQFLVVLLVDGNDATPRTPSLVTDDDTVGVRLTAADGDVEDVLFPTRDRGIVLRHLICDAGYLALRRRADGEWARVIARRINRLLISGGEVISASQPCDLALVTEADVVRGDVQSSTGVTLTLRCPFVPRSVLVDGSAARVRLNRDDQRATIRLTSGRHQLWVCAR